MPVHPVWLPHSEILTFEEIHHVASLLVGMGVQNIRLSGGEPLMRRDIEELVQLLAGIPGLRQLSMTTNGFLLAEKASTLKRAGLRGVTVSLHSLKPERFREITGGGPFKAVIEGIKAAKACGFRPLKINAVIMRGCNDDEVADLAALAVEGDVAVRFIEYMPFDGQHHWGMDKVVSGKEIVEKIGERYELVVTPRQAGSTAHLYRFADGNGEIGIISSITQPFCSDCDRVRLSAGGKIVPCLFDKAGFDLRPLLRTGASDEVLVNFMREAILRKAPGVETLLKEYKQLRHVRPMHTIGG
jgi:cyclic pyranopterin phosphate synthase